MTHNIRIRGERKEFDPQRYAHLVIAVAKELVRRDDESKNEPEHEATTRTEADR